MYRGVGRDVAEDETDLGERRKRAGALLATEFCSCAAGNRIMPPLIKHWQKGNSFAAKDAPWY